MLNTIYKPLKSGTDIRGVAVDGVEGQPLQLTDELVNQIGYGFATWLFQHVPTKDTPLTVAVGHDSRISADRMKAALIPALTDCGINVKDCDLASTPAMFMTTVNFGCDAAVEITASHHPFNRNGLKFFTRQGGINGTEVEEILQLAQDDVKKISDQKGTVEETDYMTIYAENLRNLICEGVNADDYNRPLRGFHIVVDAGNGVGGFYATKVLEPLGADVSGSQFLEPDGMFPNHIPNPEDEIAMSYISQAVKQNQADLGVIFDTDVDRAACVAADGREINRNALIALASSIALEGNEGGTIVTDSVTSSGLKSFIEDTLGGKHHRFKRGYRNVIDECRRLNMEELKNSPLAIETSGHAAMRDNYYLDDGAYLITRIIIKAAALRKEDKTLDSLIEDLVEPAEAKEYRIKILDPDFRAYGNKIIEDLTRYIEGREDYQLATDSYEGIRASKAEAEGWFLLRLSVHDPILPLNIESNKIGGVEDILADIKAFLGDYDQLDCLCLG